MSINCPVIYEDRELAFKIENFYFQNRVECPAYLIPSQAGQAGFSHKGRLLSREGVICRKSPVSLVCKWNYISNIRLLEKQGPLHEFPS